MLAALALATSLPLWAAPAEHAIMIRPAKVYLGPEASGEALLTLQRGNEIAVFERVPGFAHVLATVFERDQQESRDVSGWIVDNGYVTAKTEHGDQILYGEAVEAETQASMENGRKGAAAEARRLYQRVYDYFPASPLAGEALYRAADIAWQIDRADMVSRRSYRQASNDRLPIDEEKMHQVAHKFPHTKWADLADYRTLDNKLCGDWESESKCPSMEAEAYLKYAEKHPNSPVLAEALYNATYRLAALIDIYPTEDKAKKVPEARKSAEQTAQRLLQLNASEDWNARARRILYLISTSVPVYGLAVK